MRNPTGRLFLQFLTSVISVGIVCQIAGAIKEKQTHRFPAEGLVLGETEIEFDIVHPVRLDLNGKFMTHDLNFMSETHDVTTVLRRKRGVDAQFREAEPRLMYSIPIGDHLVTLNLTENEDLIPNDFVIERTGVNRKSRESVTSSFSRGTRYPCYFRGHVEGQPNSRVAVSTCHGLTGLLITESGDYFIEPLKPHRAANFATEDVLKSQPHKIYSSDVASILEKAEPMLHYDKLVTDDKRAHLKRIFIEGKNIGPLLDAGPVQPPPLSKALPKEYCGVLDTKRRYRHIIKNREKWEKRVHNSDGQKSQRSEDRSRRRSKRSVSVERVIEMLVVVDKKMVDFYEGNDHGGVEKYALTIVNMVSELFKDATIGNSLQVSLVRLILLDDEEKGPKITTHAENTLDRFCKWAKKINPKGDDHPNHHDVAVLLTRREICSQSNKSCETLGLAHVAGMCQSHRSCNVNQDIGLSLAYTVAHELGHNFAMHHDGQLNDCKPSPKRNHVMAPHLTSSKLPMKWSSCSRRYITRFLDRNWGFCLNDRPADHKEFSPPTALPGVIYDADHQCRLMFGEKSKYCRDVDDMCDRLWCHVDGTCRTRLHAAAAGTKCGKDKWCLGGKCVSVKKQPIVVDGDWGDWSNWSSCSRTCGIGVSSSVRDCDNPAPDNGGKYCIGERKRYKTCSKWRCRVKKGTLSFRGEQCAAFNSVEYKNKTFKWKPVESALYPCELHCYTRAGKNHFADRLSDKVIDGTKCFPGSNDICVDGICRRVGCDKNIASRALEDRCGVCHGNGSACYEVSKIFSRKKGEEYAPVALLPLGARNIEISEVTPVSNFLALRHATNKTYFYLNGNYMIQWDTMFQLAGTQFSYRRENETRDIIGAPGPLTEALMLMVLYVEENPGVSVAYSVPYDVNFDPAPEEDYPEFNWKVTDWTNCSRECGKGQQILKVVCEEKKAGIVDDFFCNVTDLPAEKKRSCNESPCPARWWTASWESCSVTCGNLKGMQHRLVACVRSVGEGDQMKLNITECLHLKRPEQQRKCHPETEIPCPVWRTGEWQECSKTCGGGITNRTVQCVTFITNDVIDLVDMGDIVTIEEIDIDEVGGRRGSKLRKRTKRPKGRYSHPSTREETVDRATGLLMSLEVDPIVRDFDPDLDGYDVEQDDLCDSSTRPNSQKVCNADLCPVTTSPALETSAPGDWTTGTENAGSTAEDFSTLDWTNRYDTANLTTTGTESVHNDQKSSSGPESVFTAQNSTTPELPVAAGILSNNRNVTEPLDSTKSSTQNGDGIRNFTTPNQSSLSREDDVTTTSDTVVITDDDDVTTINDDTTYPDYTENETKENQHTVRATDSFAHSDNVGVTTFVVATKSSESRRQKRIEVTRVPLQTSQHVDKDTPTATSAEEFSQISDEDGDDFSSSTTRHSVIPRPLDIEILVTQPVPFIEDLEDEGSETPASNEKEEDPTFKPLTQPRPAGNLDKRNISVVSAVIALKNLTLSEHSTIMATRKAEGRIRAETTAAPTTPSAPEITNEFDNIVDIDLGGGDGGEENQEFSDRFDPDQPSNSRIHPNEKVDNEKSRIHHDFDVLGKDDFKESTVTSKPQGDVIEIETDTKEVLIPELRNVDLDFDVEVHPKEVNPTAVIPTSTTKKHRKTTNHVTTVTSSPSTKKQPIKSSTETIPPTTSLSIKGEWISGEWGKCSVTCGVGARVRSVQCSLSDPKSCNETDKPAPAVLCNLRPCAKWVYGQWSKCSTLCGTGTRTKKIECVDERGEKALRPHHCRNLSTLTTVKISCHQSKCLKWKTSRWSSCSTPCDQGTQLRRVVCPHYGQCDSNLRPHNKKSCFVKKCVHWKASSWNKCSVHCGGGIQVRKVVCVEQATGLKANSTLCQPGLNPGRIRKCNQGQCPATDYDFSSCRADRLSKTFCVLLQNLGRCVQPSLAIQCCVTCKTYLSVRHKDKIS